MPARRSVVFVGAYGIQNAGDDAPLVVLTRGLCDLHPEVEFEFTVVGRHPDPLLEQVSGARFLRNPEHESREAARGRWFRGLNPGDERQDLERLEAAIRDADLVVAGAGNVLVDLAIDLFRGPVPLLGLYAFLADVHATPLLLYGISAGPLRTRRGRELAAWIVRRSAAVTVRDRSSRELLRELAPEAEVELLPDPVLGLEPADDAAFERALAQEGIPRRGARPRLALALRDLELLGGERSRVVETLRLLAARWELLFLPQCTDRECDDRREADVVIQALGEGATCHVVRQRHAPQVLMRFYETALATLAIRLHGAVFSAMAGTPVVGISYLPKVRGFLERIGLGALSFELSEAAPAALQTAVERAGALEREALVRRCREFAREVGGYSRRAARLLGLAGARSEPPSLAARPYSGSSKQ